MMAKQTKSFGLTEKRRRQIEAGLTRDLPAVLRTDAPEFDLDAVLARFDRLRSSLTNRIFYSSRAQQGFATPLRRATSCGRSWSSRPGSADPSSESNNARARDSGVVNRSFVLP